MALVTSVTLEQFQRQAFTTLTSFPSTSILSSTMSNQPNDYFLEPLWNLNKALARLWWPEPRSANLNSATANRHPVSAPPILRAPSPANRAVDARLTVAGDIPDNPAAHQVTIGYDQVQHHTEETGDRSLNGLCSHKISFTVANKYYLVAPSVYPCTSTTHLSNVPIDGELASADSDSHVQNHQSVNTGTTNT